MIENTTTSQNVEFETKIARDETGCSETLVFLDVKLFHKHNPLQQLLPHDIITRVGGLERRVSASAASEP